ncbi:alpha/beta hydrolase [Atopobacter phocae]|uniref:alpha/beta hydrolase n=1 Tax=Atopobacter phocae TaxID=136492 RepID=UPI00046FF16F|nr:dienelactone hydrolase family protein [Atopobacter phocae]
MEYKWLKTDAKELFVMFHGTGGNMYSLLPIVGEIDSNADVLTFLGNDGVGQMRRYFPLPTNGKMSTDVLKERAEQFLEEFRTIDLSQYERITAIGYSNGANFILSILQVDPNFVDEVILLHPSNFNYDFKDEVSQIKMVATVGTTDYIAPPGDIVQMHKEMSAQKFPHFDIKMFDGGHGVSEEEIEFLKTHYKN